MIEAVLIKMLVDCSKPRMDFTEFWMAAYHMPFPGYRAEDASTIHLRVIEATSSYVDYAVSYFDKCGRGR